MIGTRYHAMMLCLLMVSILRKGFKFKVLRANFPYFSIMVFLVLSEQMPC